MRRRLRTVIDVILLMMVLPLLGITLAKKPVMAYLQFPPLTRYVEHAGFSWAAFIILAVILSVLLLPFILRVLRRARRSLELSSNACAYPLWGWGGIVLTVIAWIMAWNRFEWFVSFQVFTFTPLWLGYIIVVNGLTYMRTGKCMMLDRPRHFLQLFLLSALFWWYFEYLNRFVQNWYYEGGVAGLSQWQYFIYATLPFSTVLPAVLGTYDLLSSMPRVSAGLDDFIHIRVKHPRVLSWVTITLFSAGLSVIGIWPDYLFPLLWISPLLIITSLQGIYGEENIFSDLKNGDWRKIWLLAVSALICGVFWELWNYKSVAKWIYAVPYVERFKIFEMPVLGYAGYLPFGLECAVIADLLQKRKESKGDQPFEQIDYKGEVPHFANVCKYGNAVIILFFTFSVFVMPVANIWINISGNGLAGEDIPALAWRLHKKITPKYAVWARERVESGAAANLELYDVPSTEWPMFGSVFYLWTTESLQREWEKNKNLSKKAPVEYAREAIDASMALILDPVHHTWVRQHWGDDYMHQENVFFRSLIMAGIISHENILGTGEHLELLRDQADSLSAELDASPYGVLEDYPQECYPIDVFMAIAVIKRADELLGTDHGEFLERSIRAFEGDMLDSLGLIPYLADSTSGQLLSTSRGIGNSHILIYANELWPDKAKEWYALYEKHFWQDKWWAAGYREYPKQMKYLDWSYDVDAGPIISGFSPAGNAFGVAAARINGRLDHAYTLSAQVVGACLPTIGGRLMGPMLLSDWEHAPYLGEVCVMYLLSRTPAEDVEIIDGGYIPPVLYIGSVTFLTIAALIIWLVKARFNSWRNRRQRVMVRAEKVQFFIWTVFVFTAVVLSFSGQAIIGIILFVIAQGFPLYETE